MIDEKEKTLRDFVHEAIVPLIEDVLVKRLYQALEVVASEIKAPRKEWQGLDDEDWMNIPDFQKEGCELDAAIYDWIEARLKEKNLGL